jgi:hypothetical protein
MVSWPLNLWMTLDCPVAPMPLLLDRVVASHFSSTMIFWISIFALTPSYNLFILPTGFLKRNMSSTSSNIPRTLFKMPGSISDTKRTEGRSI